MYCAQAFIKELKIIVLPFVLQKDSDVMKIDIQCAVEGDVVLECVH